jgi:hypothetical protein
VKWLGAIRQTFQPLANARWKLGYGQGTPEHYVREEALFYFEDSQRPTNRQDSHTKRLKKKTLVIFIPKRCEMVGCDKTDIPTFGKCKVGAWIWPRNTRTLCQGRFYFEAFEKED